MSASTEPLASAAPTTESIYTGIVPVVLKHADREDRATTLTVALAYGVAQPRNQKVLHVQLTDESDSFLLYTLDISEDEFHALKAEQSILVDFPTFPLKLVELLRHCQAAHAEENPRFVATLSTLGGAPVFALTEINTFRQVTHLSLRFVAGNDGAIKKYLAGRVADFKTDIAALREEGALRTRQLQETAALAAQQAERLRAADEEHARVASELHAQHAAAVAEVREQGVAAQQGQARAADAERARLGEKAEAEVGAARQAQRAAEAQAASLTASSHELQLRLSDREAKLAGVEQEVALLRKTTAELREENAELAATKHRQEKAAGAKEVRRACPAPHTAPLSPHPSPPPPRTSAHLPLPLPSPRTQVELSALTQSVTDKEELLAKQAALLEAANDAKRNAMESAAHFKEDNLKLQARVAAAAAEITKGNTIIAKLQGDKKGLQGKLKLKAAVIAQQHEAAAAKQSELETSERAAAETRAKLAEATAEKERSDEGGEATKAQLAEAQELLRSNQQVIQWLNKELNDAQSGHRLYGGAYASRMAAFRPAAGGSAASAMASAMPTTAASAMGTPTKPTAASELKERAAMMAGGGGGGGGFGSAVMAPVGACAAAPPAATAGMASLRSKAGMAAVSSPPPARAAASAKAEDGAVGGGGFSAYLSPASGTQGGATA